VSRTATDPDEPDRDEPDRDEPDRGEGERRGRRPRRRDPVVEAQQARVSDLDRATFDRERARAARRRAALDRAEYRPGPPSDDDYVVPDRSQVRRVTGTPEPLADVLDSVLDRRQWRERMRSATVFADWEAVVGADVARNCEPVRLAGGVLVVAATSSSWATQLRYLAPKLRLAVNTALGEPLVERVEVTVRR
jgi:predicted nucleic acid-binding Zn ribbon protein